MIAKNSGNSVVHFISSHIRPKQNKQLTVYTMIRRWTRTDRGCRSEIISPVKVIVIIVLGPAKTQSIVKGAAYKIYNSRVLHSYLKKV